MPCNFWFYVIMHAAWMMNVIPEKYKDCLASPFLLVHGVGHDERTWISLFLLCYFHHKKDGNDTHSKHMAHTMDCVVICCSPTSIPLMVYNPRNHQYYKPDSYCLDSYHLLGSVYPTLKYNGGLFCSLLQDDNSSFKENYHPGTRVKRINLSINMLLAGTVMVTPFLLDPSGDGSVPLYTILFDNGTTASIPLSNMARIIPLPPVNVADSDSHDSLLPLFLCLNSNITFEHKCQYHNGCLGQRDGIYHFV
jgi:hypothetical protein